MKRRWWIGAVLIFIMVFTPLLMFMAYRNSVAADFDQLRKDGAPTTYAELDEAAPKSDNAGPIFEAVAKRLKTTESRDQHLLEAYAMGMKPFTVDVVDALQKLQPDVDALCRASKMKNCSLTPATESKFGERSMTPIIDQIYVTALLPNAARVEAKRGNLKQAFVDLSAMNGIIRLQRQLPGFLAYLRTHDQRRSQIDCWADILNAHQDRVSVQMALDVVKDPPATPNLRWMVKTEIPGIRSQMEYMSHHPSEWANEVKRYYSVDPLTINPIAMRIGEAQLIHTFRVAVEGIQDDPEKWKINQDFLHDLGAKTNQKWPIKHLNENCFPLYGDVCSNIPTVLAAQRVSKTAAMLMRYRLDQGAYPSSLPFSGKDVTDPFTGKPLRYRRDGKGFAVWSVGADMSDDGGRPARHYSESPDVAVAID